MYDAHDAFLRGFEVFFSGAWRSFAAALRYCVPYTRGVGSPCVRLRAYTYIPTHGFVSSQTLNPRQTLPCHLWAAFPLLSVLCAWGMQTNFNNSLRET